MSNQIDNANYKVMLVDDSSVIRAFLTKLLSSETDIKIVAEAENGKIACDIVEQMDIHNKPDVILLDIEMPVMDGISSLPRILKSSPSSKVIMVSTLTKNNAAVSIRALSEGASDYLEKPNTSTNIAKFKLELIEKIKLLATSKSKKEALAFEHKNNSTLKSEPIERSQKQAYKKKPEAIAIGCSTGGPKALASLFNLLKDQIKDVPIFITQHMPAAFTTFLAENISKNANTQCYEAQDGMEVIPGGIYLAPGDYHMSLKKEDSKVLVSLNKEPPENFCRPAVDPMLRALSEIYKQDLLVIILTGMGQDGLDGVRRASEKGAHVIIQDEETSVVWGMPGVVAKNNLQNETLPLDEIAQRLIEIYKS